MKLDFRGSGNATVVKQTCKESYDKHGDFLGWENVFTVRADEQTLSISVFCYLRNLETDDRRKSSVF